MAEYKPKLKDVALAAQTAGRQAEHAINGVRELREEIAKCKKDITQLRHEMFADKEFERMIVGNDVNTIKVDNSIGIELATFAKNKCPHCGSHNLRFTFVPDAFSDSMVNCRDCHNSWKIGKCAEDIDSPYEVANKLRSEHRTLFEENKDLQYEIEKLRKQAAIDASYMVTVEDLMFRLKNREERIEALKKDIDTYIDEKNDLYLINVQLEEKCHKMEAEIRRLNEDFTTLNKENGELKKGALVDWLTKKCSELETKNEELKQGVEKLKDMEKFFDKYFKSLTPAQNTVIGYLGRENDILEKENEKLLIDNAVLESDNDFLRHEIDEYKDKINVLKDEKRNLQKEKEELKKALNIYQNITDLDVTLTRNTAYVRFIDSDDAGRAMVKGDALDALCDAYLRYYDGFRKEKKDEENK